MSALPATANLDRLSSLLERFRFKARLSFSGTMCGLHSFPADRQRGYLHVLRKGSVEVSHPSLKTADRHVTLTEPTLIFYPRPLTHHFRNPPKDGSDFTCAEIEFEGADLHPIAHALPPVMMLPLHEVQGLQATLDVLFAETSQVRCGQRLLADRLFEVVLIQMLRWLLDHPQATGSSTGLLFGFSSPQIARALVAMHEQPEKSWDIQQLADTSGMSRTTFATRFKELVGKPPSEYLTDWRLSICQSKLREGTPLKLLVSELGYSNQSALSRVFSQRLGLSPRQWLQKTQLKN
jgi:AraC-like DNA-binding protein